VTLLLALLCQSDPAALIQRLGADDPAERERATQALEALGEKAVPMLREATRAKDPEVAARAKQILRAIEGAAYARRLQSSEVGDALKAHPEFLEALLRGNPDVRREWVRRIGGIERVAGGVRGRLYDYDLQMGRRVRALLLRELLGADLEDIARVEALHGMYVLNRLLVEDGAAPLLWEAPKETVEAFGNAALAGNLADRVVAITCLASLADAAAEEALVALTGASEEDVRYIAMRGLQARMAANRRGAIIERLRDMDKSGFCPRAAIEILAYFGGDDAKRAVLEEFRAAAQGERSRYTAEIAAWALGRLRVKEAADELVPLLESEGYPLKVCAAKALTRVGEARHAPALARLLGYEGTESMWVRGDAMSALARWGLPAEEARRLAESHDRDTRTRAISLLVRSGEAVNAKTVVECFEHDDPSRAWLLVALNRMEDPAVRVRADGWRESAGHYATGVTWAEAQCVHKGVQLKHLYRYERTMSIGAAAAEAAEAAKLEADVAKELRAEAADLQVAFPDPTVEELLVALAEQGAAPIVDGKRLRIVPAGEAIRHWKGRLK
jgi:HEAT repeat protein